jgi:hypothetical protein
MKQLLIAIALASSIGTAIQPSSPEPLSSVTTGESPANSKSKMVFKDERSLDCFRKIEVANLNNLQQIRTLLRRSA